MCLKIPFLFALCFFWRLRVVFKHFFTNVRVGNTAFNGKLQSPLLLCFQELGLEGKRACSTVRSSTRAGFAGWDGAALVHSDEQRAAHCPHSPLQVGTRDGGGGSWMSILELQLWDGEVAWVGPFSWGLAGHVAHWLPYCTWSYARRGDPGAALPALTYFPLCAFWHRGCGWRVSAGSVHELGVAGVTSGDK